MPPVQNTPNTPWYERITPTWWTIIIVVILCLLMFINDMVNGPSRDPQQMIRDYEMHKLRQEYDR